MSSKEVSHLSDIASQETNTTGQMDTILAIDPDSGTRLRLSNQIPTGSASGLAIFFKLRDNNSNALPTDTEFLLRAERPTDDTPVAVSTKEDNIAAWNALDISDQRDQDNIDAVKVELKGSAVNIRDKDELLVSVNSSVQVDWSNSELYIVRQGVDELPFEG